MKAIDRIYQYIEYKSIKVVDFEKKNHISNGYLSKMKSRSAGIGEDILNQILENCPEISPGWLLTGSGSMLKTDTPAPSQSTPAPEHPHADLKVITDLTDRLINDNGDLREQLGMQIKENEQLHEKNMKLLAEIEELKAKKNTPAYSVHRTTSAVAEPKGEYK